MNIVTLLEGLVNSLNEAEKNFFDNPKDFYSLENSVKSTTEAFAASYLGSVLSSINTQIYKDSWRKGKYNVQRNDTRTLITSVGDVTFESTYYKKCETNEYHYLVEEILGIDAHERFSEAAEAAMLTEALKSSYEEASKVIPTKSEITKTTVMNKVHGIAEEIPKEKPKKQKEVKYLFIEADEDHVAEQHGRWNDKKENGSFISKLAYVYEYKQENPKCKGRKELVNTFYFGGVYDEAEGIERLWNKVGRFIEDNYNYDILERVYISGDAGAWIKSGTDYIVNSKFCFDKYHLTQYINKACNQMLDESDIAKEEVYRLLYKRNKKEVLEYINLMKNYAENQKPVEDFITLLKRNWLPIMRTLHDEILSGCSTEAHVSHVLSERLSSRPKGWSRRGADRMSKLRCYEKNYGREKIIDLVKYSREKRKLQRTGTDGMEVRDISLREILKEDRNQSRKYIDTMQATVPGITTRKIFSIREQIKLI